MLRNWQHQIKLHLSRPITKWNYYDIYFNIPLDLEWSIRDNDDPFLSLKGCCIELSTEDITFDYHAIFDEMKGKLAKLAIYNRVAKVLYKYNVKKLAEERMKLTEMKEEIKELLE